MFRKLTCSFNWNANDLDVFQSRDKRQDFVSIEKIYLTSSHHDIELDNCLRRTPEDRLKEMSWDKLFLSIFSLPSLSLYVVYVKVHRFYVDDTVSMSRRRIRDDFMLWPIYSTRFSLSRAFASRCFFMPFTHTLPSSIVLVQFDRHVTRISSTMRGKEKDV